MARGRRPQDTRTPFLRRWSQAAPGKHRRNARVLSYFMPRLASRDRASWNQRVARR
jgi:hypothetical protein